MALSICLSWLLVAPPTCKADVFSDSDQLLVQLNPVSAAVDGVIGEAASKGDAMLQKQLEHLRGVINQALFDLDQVPKKRGEGMDEAAVKDITMLNNYVKSDLVQFDALVGKHLNPLDKTLYKRINQFNFGFRIPRQSRMRGECIFVCNRISASLTLSEVPQYLERNLCHLGPKHLLSWRHNIPCSRNPPRPVSPWPSMKA
jgi:hypothetical protein